MNPIPYFFIYMYDYSGILADTKLYFGFHYSDTAAYYGDTLTASPYIQEDRIIVPVEDIKEWMHRWNVRQAAYSEYVCSCSYACDRLLKSRRMVFHGAAMLWNDQAYIFSAPSGTGKTTQLKLWEKLFPAETTILNGDKPILDAGNPEKIMVYPSPWKGKEGYGRDDIIAPLGGIILLRQAAENSIKQLEPVESSRFLFARVCSTFRTKEEILNTASMIESVVSAVPVWLLCNKGDDDSVRMTYQTLQKKECRLCVTD